MSARPSSTLRSISAYVAWSLRKGLFAGIALLGASFPWLILAPMSGAHAQSVARAGAAAIPADTAPPCVEAEPARPTAAERQARPEALARRIALKRAQMAAVERELGANRRAGESRVAEARARHREARAAAAFARSEAALAEQLHLKSVVPRADVDRSKGEVLSREAQAEVARAAVERAAAEGLAKEAELEAKIALVTLELAELQAQAPEAPTAPATREAAAAR